MLSVLFGFFSKIDGIEVSLKEFPVKLQLWGCFPFTVSAFRAEITHVFNFEEKVEFRIEKLEINLR